MSKDTKTRLYEPTRSFEYENGFYATASPARISKFMTHLELYKQTVGLRGEVLECGVFKGNSLFRWIKFRDLLENTFSRKIIAFDAFGAFPETEYEPDRKKREEFIKETDGGHGISIEELNDLLNVHQLNRNVDLIAGDLTLTLPDYLESNEALKLSLLHIDVDIYEPTKAALELLFDRVVTGGVIILDDYGAFPGANKAIEEVFQGRYKIQKLPYSNAIGFIVK